MRRLIEWRDRHAQVLGALVIAIAAAGYMSWVRSVIYVPYCEGIAGYIDPLCWGREAHVNQDIQLPALHASTKD